MHPKNLWTTSGSVEANMVRITDNGPDGFAIAFLCIELTIVNVRCHRAAILGASVMPVLWGNTLLPNGMPR